MPIKTRTEIVKEVVDNYKILNQHNFGYPCTYGVISLDKPEYNKRFSNTSCHSALYGTSINGVYDEIITSYPICDEVWFDFIKNNLFEKYSDHFHLEFFNEISYVSVTGLESIPAKIAYIFCIFTRIPFEFSDKIKNWYKLCSLGLNPIASFVFSTFQPYVEDIKESILDQRIKSLIINNNVNHWPMFNTASLKIMLDRDYQGDMTPYKKNSFVCIPTNMIWGECKELQPAVGKTVREFCKLWNKEHPEYENLLQPS